MIRIKWIAVPLALAVASARAAGGDPAPSAGSLLQVLLGLVVVLMLMAAAAWLLKRFGMARTAANSAVKIVGGISVGNRERVLVLEVADQWIVVGVAAGRVSALATMPRQEQIAEAATGAPPAASFSEWLKQTIDKRHGNR